MRRLRRYATALTRTWQAHHHPYHPRHSLDAALDTLWRIRIHEMAVRRNTQGATT